MLIDLFLSLPTNIITKINYLKQDYLGTNLDITFLNNFLFGFFIAFGLIVISSLIGKIIRKFIFKNEKIIDEVNLIDIGLGYILISTGMGILGVLSVLQPTVIWLYIIVLFCIALYPFNNISKLLPQVIYYLKKLLDNFKLNKFVFTWVMLFIILAAINLLNPEIREDQYHVDLPKIYLSQQTIMIPLRETFGVSSSPLLGEMYYTIGIFLGSKESARFIHFFFYMFVLLELLAISKKPKYKFAIYSLLIFTSAPVVIHETSSMYVDFQWIFCLLLSVSILTFSKKLNFLNIGLSGFLLGGMVSTKLWTIVIIPVCVIYLVYLLKKIPLLLITKYVLTFIASIFFVSGLWFFRALILTGNPLFPAFENSGEISFLNSLQHYVGLNTPLLNPVDYINVFSPLFFLGFLLLLFNFKRNLGFSFKLNLIKFSFLILLLYISIHYPFGRYLLGLYIFLMFLPAVGIENALKKIKYTKYLLNLVLLILFLYYLLNSLLVLPYAIGFADKNKYLTRILSRDNSSYYDFNKQFDKYIKKEDYVATYRIYGYFYANFRFANINYILGKRESFDLLKNNGITKLFIRGGEIKWFCKELQLTDCYPSKYSLISSTLTFPTYYLYSIK